MPKVLYGLNLRGPEPALEACLSEIRALRLGSRRVRLHHDRLFVGDIESNVAKAVGEVARRRGCAVTQGSVPRVVYTEGELDSAHVLGLNVRCVRLDSDEVSQGLPEPHDGCGRCGSGRTIRPPLRLRFDDRRRESRVRFAQTYLTAQIVAGVSQAAAVAGSGLGGVTFERVEVGGGTSEHLRWLRTEHLAPPLAMSGALAREEPCPACSRGGFSLTADTLGYDGLVIEGPLDAAIDLAYLREELAPVIDRRHGGRRKAVVSQRGRRVLSAIDGTLFEFTPIAIAGTEDVQRFAIPAAPPGPG